jgi:LmbE family N-acetylglucosaminyl deacetylase
MAVPELPSDRIHTWRSDDPAPAAVVGVGAHADDLELGMASFILDCYDSDSRSFVGVTCTDGAGAFRAPGFEHLSEQRYVEVRREEQFAAARMGRYGSMIQLGHPESAVSDGSAVAAMTDEIEEVLEATQPATVVTHCLTDRHIHHRRVGLATVRACRRLRRPPAALLGVEIWGGLEWLQPFVVALPVDDPGGLIDRLVNCHVSQVGHTPYGQASDARRFVNGTYDLGRQIGVRRDVAYAMDLTPLLADVATDPVDFIAELTRSATSAAVERLRTDG